MARADRGLIGALVIAALSVATIWMAPTAAAETKIPEGCSGSLPPYWCLEYLKVAAEDDGWGLGSQMGDEASSVPANYDSGDAPDDSMIDDLAERYPRNCAINTVDEDGEVTETLECYPDDVEPQAIVDWVATMATQYQRLTLTPSTISYQPNGDWALVNMDFIVYTDPSPQTLTTELFGVEIAVRSTPVHYEWDFGDGATLSTSDAGSAYPDHTVTHVYSQASDGVVVNLTTSWRGEFQIAGSDTWIPIAGLATTTSSTAPIEIVAMDVHLVPNA